MIYTKVCGITKIEDAISAIQLGYNAIGFNFYPKSKRYIEPKKVKKIIENLPPFISTVGIFVNSDPDIINDVCNYTKISVVQLHGGETPEDCNKINRTVIKAFGVDADFNFSKLADYNVSAFLLDYHAPELFGGTGQIFDWALVEKAKPYGRIILAGGLTPFNIEDAIKASEPFGVDVNSGVEILPGEKNQSKMREIVERIRRINI